MSNKELKSQIARMQAELERLGVAQVSEKQKLVDLLKDEVGKIDAELEKFDEKKAELEAEKQEMQDLLSNLESGDDTQKVEEDDTQKVEEDDTQKVEEDDTRKVEDSGKESEENS
ncbi:hypothetical protein H6F77_12160 [Microcoleus sp. FACHB-831]|uniref:hypothetical protein n=1 Tax=Microcoleus sp. FACHB-831 TaxID=2692827 RepID=UPI0016858AB2|nr:hypothetical protein [Microcoleus sp. FACHB-831]MBD1921843.1 hypothetical protein [Microcoleus sp. FACHB-831]